MMKKMIITLEVEGEAKECQLRIPLSVCEHIELERLQSGISDIFSQVPGIDVLSIESTEEIRHHMHRRAEDAESGKFA